MSALGICLLVGTQLRARLPGDEFSLAWQHSVARTRWEERYEVRHGELALVEATVAGTGAGMEPPPEAIYAGGRWRWRPATPPLAELRLTHSRFTQDYELCWAGRCSKLGALIHARSRTEVVSVKACMPEQSRSPLARPSPPSTHR